MARSIRKGNSVKQVKVIVLPEVKDEGGSPERCEMCNGSRWLSFGGGISITMFGDYLPDCELGLSLCCACATNLAASIQAQVCFVHGERYRKGAIR